MVEPFPALDAVPSAELVRVLFAQAGDALLLIDPAAERICDANRMAEKLTQLSRDELLQLPLRDILQDERGTNWLATFQAQDGFLVRAGGPDQWTAAAVSVVQLNRTETGPLAVVTIRDCREQAEWHRQQLPTWVWSESLYRVSL